MFEINLKTCVEIRVGAFNTKTTRVSKRFILEIWTTSFKNTLIRTYVRDKFLIMDNSSCNQ